MPHLQPLRLQILRVVRIRRSLDRDDLDDLQSVAFEADDLLRIIRQEAHLADAEIDALVHSILARPLAA